jgi:hypothetical protein
MKYGLIGGAGNPLPAARPNVNFGAHGVTRPTFKYFAPSVFIYVHPWSRLCIFDFG